jgi:hypothetical protein
MTKNIAAKKIITNEVIRSLLFISFPKSFIVFFLNIHFKTDIAIMA